MTGVSVTRRDRRCGEYIHVYILAGMIARPKTTGPGKRIRFVRRTQKRKPRRLLEAPAGDWARWEHFATLEGLNWSEFTRRALEQRCSSIGELEREAKRTPALLGRLPGLAEKGPPKNGANGAAKRARPGRAEKGSSRS